MCLSSRVLQASIVLLLAAQAAQAAPVVSLSTNAPDLTNLVIGQNFQVTVALSGLGAGDTLDFLAATVGFDGPLLGTPAAISPGAVVPELSEFSSGALPGVADGLYDDVFDPTPTPISTNGVFFAFSLTVLAEGTGTIGFSFVDSSGFDAVGSPLETVVAAGSLRYAIPAAAVPEPASWLLLWSAIPVAAAVRAIRHHRGRLAR